MSNPFEAVTANSVIAGMVTDDRQTAVIELETSPVPLRLALPVSALGQLAILALDLEGQALSPDSEPGLAKVHPIEWWEVGKAGGDVVLSFQFLDGRKLAFGLQELHARNLHETLGVALQFASPMTPSTTQ